MSKIFFPLRTSVELFEAPENPAAVTRAKEAAILYEELIFESGLYDVTITPEGSTNFWNPPEHLDAEMLAQSRRPIAIGGPFTLAIGAQKEQGVPAEEMHVAIEGAISARYAAEFHTGILEELAEFEPDWVTTIPGGASRPGGPGDPVWEEIGGSTSPIWGNPT